MSRAQLTVLQDGTTVTLEADLVVGRAQSCGLVLQSDACSRRHLRVTVGEVVEVEDLGSAAGTFLARGGEQPRRIDRAVLAHGDLLLVGDRTLVFHLAPPRSSALAGLIQRVSDCPDDDEARLVLADALAEAGDPQGELMVLQVAASGRPRGLARGREQDLLRRHGRVWTPPGVVAESAEFVRGLVHRCRWTGPTDPGHLGWVGVAHLTCDLSAPMDPSQSPFARPRPALREVDNLGVYSLPTVRGATLPRLERLSVQLPLDDLVARCADLLTGVPPHETLVVLPELALAARRDVRPLVEALGEVLRGRVKRLRLRAPTGSIGPEALGPSPGVGVELEDPRTGRLTVVR